MSKENNNRINKHTYLKFNGVGGLVIAIANENNFTAVAMQFLEWLKHSIPGLLHIYILTGARKSHAKIFIIAMEHLNNINLGFYF